MKLTTRARYAVRSMVAISRLSTDNQPVSLERVAARTRLSKRYLGQLAIKLKKASLIRGVSGRRGGYLLAKAPEEIKIGQIVEATIGPINIVDCVLEPDTCMLSDYCECRELYSLVNEKIRGVFYGFTLADLAAKNESSKSRPRGDAIPGGCGGLLEGRTASAAKDDRNEMGQKGSATAAQVTRRARRSRVAKTKKKRME